jgi:hypothetical protein
VAGHGVCTADPWIFSGEPVPDTTLAADAGDVLAAKACTGTDAIHTSADCGSLVTRADEAEKNLQGYVWRAAHPNPAGQRAIAALVERQLRGRV